MEDVARQAGVSRSLVSLVFQDAPNVSKARRAAVLEAAELLDYRPNRLARNLARGRTMTLGVVIDDLHPFFARCVEGIEQHADGAGYHVLIANGARNATRTADALSTFGSLQVDGAIAVGARGDISALNRATADIPLVLVSFEAPASEVDTVNNDESNGATLVVDHLVELGHERILHVDGGQGASASGRRAGYSAAMKRVGLGSQIDVIVADYTYESGQQAATTIAGLSDRPTAVFAANDLNALGMISEFNRLGIGGAIRDIGCRVRRHVVCRSRGAGSHDHPSTSPRNGFTSRGTIGRTDRMWSYHYCARGAPTHVGGARYHCPGGPLSELYHAAPGQSENVNLVMRS